MVWLALLFSLAGCAPLDASPRQAGRSHLLPDRFEDAETGVVCYYFGYNINAGLSCVVPKRMPLTLPERPPLGAADPTLLPPPK